MRTLSAYLRNLPFRIQAEKHPTARQKLKKNKRKVLKKFASMKNCSTFAIPNEKQASFAKTKQIPE